MLQVLLDILQRINATLQPNQRPPLKLAGFKVTHVPAHSAARDSGWSGGNGAAQHVIRNERLAAAFAGAGAGAGNVNGSSAAIGGSASRVAAEETNGAVSRVSSSSSVGGGGGSGRPPSLRRPGAPSR